MRISSELVDPPGRSGQADASVTSTSGSPHAPHHGSPCPSLTTCTRATLTCLLLCRVAPACSAEHTATAADAREPSAPAAIAPISPRSDAAAAAAERAVLCVVNVSSTKVVRAPGRTPPFVDSPRLEQSLGDRAGANCRRSATRTAWAWGVIVDAHGTVLTDNHVITSRS